MPIYEYRCRDCSNVFARLQKVGADAKAIACPACGSTDVEREVSVFSGGSKGDAGRAGGVPSGPPCSGFT